VATATDHECPAPGCSKRVPHDMLACRRHYHELPKALKRELYRAWDGGDGAGSPEHDAAMQACVEFWRGG